MKFSEEHNYKVKLHHRDLGDLGEEIMNEEGFDNGFDSAIGLDPIERD
jgi:hypothetical protein